MIIELNKEEANALIALLDVAVKTTGLQGAEAALLLFKKIQDASK
jgi:hypothetical protein